MDFAGLSTLINENGLAVVLLLLLCWGGYSTISPYIKKKLSKSIENDDKLEDNIHKEYFKMTKETKDMNKQFMLELKSINITNQQISATNELLAKSNSKLLESLDNRISTLEVTTDDIGKTVEKINTKIDVMLK
jgi:hypothetical protein